MRTERAPLYWLSGILLVLLTWRLGVVPVRAKLRMLDMKISKREESLKEIKRLQTEYLHFRASRVTAGNADSEEDFKPLAFLERLSQETGVKYELSYQEPRKLDDEYTETRVTVELNGIDIGQLVDYLYKVEESPLRINNLHIRIGQDNFLNVSCEISHLLRSN